MRDALLGLLILLAVACDAIILQRLRALWARADLKRSTRRRVPREPEGAAMPMSALGRLRSWEGLLLVLLVVIVALNIARSPDYLGVQKHRQPVRARRSRRRSSSWP